MKPFPHATSTFSMPLSSLQRSPQRAPPPNPSSRSPIFIREGATSPNVNFDQYELKSQKDARFQALQETIKSVYSQILEDELLHAMKEDSSSTEFLHQRVKEIFEEVIENDREIYIEKLMTQYSYVKNLYKQLEDELRRTAKELENARDQENKRNDDKFAEKKEMQRSYEALEEENRRLQAKIQSFSSNFNENMKKKDLDLQKSLEIKLEYETRIETLQKQLKELSNLNKTLKSEAEAKAQKEREFLKESENFKEINRKLAKNLEEIAQKEAALRHKTDALAEENSDLLKKLDSFKEEKALLQRDFQEKLAKAEEANKFNEESFQEFLESKKLKTKQKLENYKAKLIEYKEINANLQNTVDDLERALQKEKQHSLVNSQETAEKIKEVEDFYQEKLSEEKRQIEAQIAKIQGDFQENFAQKFAKYKAKKKALKEQFLAKSSEIDRNSLDRRTFEEMLAKKDKIIEDLTNRLISYDKEQEIKLQKHMELVESRKNAEYEQKLKAHYQNAENLQENLKQEAKKLRELQEQLQETSEKYQELSAQYEELQAISAEKSEENAGLSEELSRFLAEKQQLEETFREKERVFQRNQEQFDKISAENAYLSRSLDEKEEKVKQNFKEIEKLQRNLAISSEKAEKLQGDLFTSQKNFAEFEASSKENLKLMRQSLEMITLENQSLSQRISQAQRDFLEKSEEDKRIASDLKKELYISSLKLKEKDEKLENFERSLGKAEETLRETEQKLRNSLQNAAKLEAALVSKEEERNKLISQSKTLRRRVCLIIKEKFQDIRAVFRRFDTNTAAVIQEYQGLLLQLFAYLPEKVAIFQRNHGFFLEEQREKMREELESRLKSEAIALKSRAEAQESEIKSRYEAQFEEWSARSLELTRKMEEIQANSKKMQGELHALLREKEAARSEIELLRSELEKSQGLHHVLVKEKRELQENQDFLVEERAKLLRNQFEKQEKKRVKSLKKLQKDIVLLQERNLKNLSGINGEIQALQRKYEAETRDFSLKSQRNAEKIAGLERLLDESRHKCQEYEAFVKELEENVAELQRESAETSTKYDNHIYLLTQNFEEIAKSAKQEKERLLKENSEKSSENEVFKAKVNKLDAENKRKDQEIYELLQQKQKIQQNFEETLVKFSLQNSHCEKEALEQAQEKRKFEDEVENLQNLLTKKYHKINEIRRQDEQKLGNLDEKVRKLHDLEQELKFSLRNRALMSPEKSKIAKISTPMVKNSSDLNRQYYSSLTMKKNLAQK